MQPPARLNLRSTALFLDIDGTLAEFAPRPELVVADARRTQILRHVCEQLDGRVAVLSGRSLEDVDRILENAIEPVAAVHGLVRRDPDGMVDMTPPPPDLELARTALEAFIQDCPGLLLEDKRWSLAVHYRTRPELAEEVDRLTRALSEAYGLRRQPGSMVMELRAPGADKGVALRAFLQTPPFAGGLPIMVGDDLTDESAFAAAAEAGGFGVLVGPTRVTHAKHRLGSVRQVLDWLAET